MKRFQLVVILVATVLWGTQAMRWQEGSPPTKVLSPDQRGPARMPAAKVNSSSPTAVQKSDFQNDPKTPGQKAFSFTDKPTFKPLIDPLALAKKMQERALEVLQLARNKGLFNLPPEQVQLVQKEGTRKDLYLFEIFVSTGGVRAKLYQQYIRLQASPEGSVTAEATELHAVALDAINTAEIGSFQNAIASLSDFLVDNSLQEQDWQTSSKPMIVQSSRLGSKVVWSFVVADRNNPHRVSEIWVDAITAKVISKRPLEIVN